MTGWFGYSISFQGILGYIFYPIAWVMGVPSSEALQVGSIMATKLVSNEFVAMMDLQKIASTLSPRAEGIISVFLVSFANFSSIGIIAGAVKGLNEEQGNVVSRFGLKLVWLYPGECAVCVNRSTGAVRPYIKKPGIIPRLFLRLLIG